MIQILMWFNTKPDALLHEIACFNMTQNLSFLFQVFYFVLTWLNYISSVGIESTKFQPKRKSVNFKICWVSVTVSYTVFTLLK